MAGTIRPMITVGIDEVGRGCWAGPLVAGAVILPSKYDLEDGPIGRVVLRDSKKMTKRQRERSDKWIREFAVGFGLGWVWPAEIDEIGLTASVKLAMERAVAAISDDYTEIIIDGNINYLAEDSRSRSLIKADNIVPAVSAGSIIAKVARDTYMTGLGPTYAGYGFDKHVGYGTAVHMAALKTLGVCDMHRKSYKPVQAFII